MNKGKKEFNKYLTERQKKEVLGEDLSSEYYFKKGIIDMLDKVLELEDNAL